MRGISRRSGQDEINDVSSSVGKGEVGSKRERRIEKDGSFDFSPELEGFLVEKEKRRGKGTVVSSTRRKERKARGLDIPC